jgi:hypothetical protein
MFSCTRLYYSSVHTAVSGIPWCTQLYTRGNLTPPRQGTIVPLTSVAFSPTKFEYRGRQLTTLLSTTVPLYNSTEATVFRYQPRPCPSLVLTTVPGRARQADAKHSVTNYQGPTTSRENAIPT